MDRDRIDHAIGVELRWDGPERIVATAGYELLYQNYSSNERFDLSYRDRSDTRHTIFGELEWAFAKRWFATANANWMDESSDRAVAGDEPEESSYSRYGISIGISHRFF